MDSPQLAGAGFECNQSHAPGSGFCNTKLNLQNTPTTGVTGIPGSVPDVSTDFNGSDEYEVDLGGGFNNCIGDATFGLAAPCVNGTLHDFTAEGWVQPGSVKNAQIVGRAGTGTNGFNWALFVEATGHFVCTIYDDGAGGNYASSGNSLASYTDVPPTWYLAACTVEDSAFNIKIWVNGVADSNSGSTSGTCGAGGGLATFAIGAGDIGDPTTFFFDGKIDEVATYNRVLSATEMGEHYTAGITAAACAGDWPFTVKLERNNLQSPDGITSEALRADAFVRKVTTPGICGAPIARPELG